MEKQFAVSEVRRLSNRIPRSNDEIADAQEALRAFADLLEAREKAVPVAFRYLSQQSSTLAWVWSGWLDLGDRGISALHVHCKTSGDTKIEYAYAHPNSSDAERLAEALRVIRQHVARDPSALAVSIISTCDAALAAHSTQAQSPAASVPEALRLLQSVLCDTDGNCCIRGTYEDRRTVDKALAMLAAQENPNG